MVTLKKEVRNIFTINYPGLASKAHSFPLLRITHVAALYVEKSGADKIGAHMTPG
jgi:hypothetical protein